ncbi:unnamed protein product [Candidula unifasciata]|uniref:RRM domain-containing protein n=1 Tax=Candidula unifasciata TaxID=100452 RepID=A0A8S3ZS62_9EUPU|nr:unnamed protein product [Candidula unifasciata]
MSEDNRTLWVGNLDDRVTEALIYELFLQTGPIDKLILPAEGEGDKKKHKGHAYVVFHHPESVQYASQVLEGSSLFGQQLNMKARSLPITYKGSNQASGNRGRLDTNHRPSFNKASTWHGQNEFSARGRGSFRNQGVGSNYSQNTGFTTNYNNYNNQVNSGYWAGGQQAGSDTKPASYNTAEESLEDKRQRLLQKQNITLEAHRQVQGGMNMASQVYGMMPQQQPQHQQQQPQQQQQQGMWTTGSYNTDNWNMNQMNQNGTPAYQGYPTDQYGNWYQQ